MKEPLESMNEELNTLNIKIAVFNSHIQDKKDKLLMQKLKEDIMKAQDNFIKGIEDNYYGS